MIADSGMKPRYLDMDMLILAIVRWYSCRHITELLSSVCRVNLYNTFCFSNYSYGSLVIQFPLGLGVELELERHSHSSSRR